MKKSALLAVSALSLGVVGLATFTPVVNAVDTTATGDATVTVAVDEALSIGGEDITPGQDNPVDIFTSTMSVDFGSLKAGEAATPQTKSVTVNNNSGKAGALTVKAKGNANLVNGTHSIPAGSTIAAGTSAWGISTDGGATFKAPSTETPIEVGTDNGTESKPYSVTYGVSTAETQAAGTYKGTVTYTYTITDLGA